MNETIRPDGNAGASWPNSDHRQKVSDTAALAGSDLPAPASLGLLNQAVQGAHNTIDRLAGSAAPVARQLGASVSAAESALHARTAQLMDAGNHLVTTARTTVSRNPLLVLGAAVALGAIIGRIIGWSTRTKDAP